MTSLSTTIIWLSIAYATLGVVLLAILVFARLPWLLKAGLVVATSGFYVVAFFATRGLLGWSSPDPLPPSFKLLGARIVEPHTLEGDPGSIYLWVEALDENNFPSGVPRAYRLPYNARLAEKTETAEKASAQGAPQGGRTADFGNGDGGAGQAYQREVVPSAIINTSGGDPSSGGAAAGPAAAGDSESVRFTPLLPPRMPPKEPR